MAKHQRSHGLPAPLHTPAARPESSEPRDNSGSRARSVDSEHQIGQTGSISEAAAKTVLEQASAYRRENGESSADRKGAGTRTILDATEPTSRRDLTMDKFRILAGFLMDLGEGRILQRKWSKWATQSPGSLQKQC